METWRFLYTHLESYKKASTKTGYPKAGCHFIVVDGYSHSDCLTKAKIEGGFSDKQLMGSRRLNS